MVFADCVCVAQAYNVRDGLSVAEILALFLAQVFTVMFMGSVLQALVRKRYRRQKKPLSYRTFSGILQPLRRLYVSVWS
jgi:hypothetical protein